MTAELRIAKIPMTVELAVEGAPPIQIEVQVDEHPDRGLHRQRLLDVLEHPEPFLPAHDLGRSEWAVFNKATMLWVAVPLSSGVLPVEEEPPLDEREPLYEVRHIVAVELVSGVEHLGELLYNPREGRARVSDYLNGPGRFFRLWTDDCVFLINKSYVRRVVERDRGGTPRSKGDS